MFLTFVSVVVLALAGACYGGPPALSSDVSVLKNAYWASAKFKNTTAGIELDMLGNLYGVYVEAGCTQRIHIR